MSSPTHSVRFGPFELDLHAAELHHNSTKAKLPEQPFQILCELVEHAGEVVTRDQLRQRLWRSDTFVDFEHGLNTAVKRLREILGDSAENPLYIETLPRHGYRLMVPVEKPEQTAAAVSKARVQPWKIWLAASAVIAVVVALAAGLVWRQRSRHVHVLTPSDTIVLADFVNSTGDPVFDDALRQALIVHLEQSPFLNILPEARVQQTLHLMERSPDQRLTPELGREVCQRTGAKALLWGSIASLGNQYVIGLTALECSTGNHLASEQTQSATKDDVLKALGRAASDLRNKLGESLSSLQKFDAPIEVTTSSLQALQAYGQGERASARKGNLAGIPFYERAIELDPNFASAYATLAARLSNLGRNALARDASGKAFALRDRVSEYERFRISALYYDFVFGDSEHAIQTYRQWTQSYPLHVVPHANLGDDLMQLGRWGEAEAENRDALRLSPTPAWMGYFNLAYSGLALNQPDAAEAMIKQALMHHFDAAELSLPTYELAFLRGNTQEMERVLADGAAKDFGPSLLAVHSDTQAYYGRLDRARQFSRRAVESELRAGSKDVAALFQANAALREAEFGSPAVAQRGIATALTPPPGLLVKVVAALALARIGDTERAQAIVKEIEKNNASNTLLNFYWLPSIKAAIDMKKANPTSAITVLESATPYELGRTRELHLGTLYPAYLRGQAYMQAHNGLAAAAEFQKLLDHPGIVLNHPLGALARLQLGRAYAMSGDVTKAKAAYLDFLTLWKDADRDIPILKQAKAEYAKLQWS